jgi:hypothetical protein
MDAKLRAFLKRNGVPDDALDKMERGEVPDDDGVLRKGIDNPVLRKIREVEDLLADIKRRVEQIERADAHSAAFARGVEKFQSAKMNGVKHHDGVHVALAAIAGKGQ